ncbi:MAG: 50S ribosomal protein L22 [Candidatus Omnitrophica bacterium]|nr:50S ribosomal protein L22 [Candidatus Omnitrophota bacterium]
MISKATARYIRISPRKTRLVTNYIKGKKVAEALAILANINKKACDYIEGLLKSAISNAKRNPAVDEKDLYISKLVVDGGPSLRRYRAGTMGRAMMILHRTSHISIELDAVVKKVKEDKPKKNAKKRTLLKRSK